jgi:hypothetical protein
LRQNPRLDAFLRKGRTLAGLAALYVVGAIVTLTALAALYFLFHNHASPRFMEFTVGTAAAGLVIGILTSLVFVSLERWAKHKSMRPNRRELKALVTLFGVLLVCLALSVYASNTPNEIRRVLTVTYFVNAKSKELPSTLHLPGTEASFCYDTVTRFFKEFRKRHPEQVEGLLSRAATPESFRVIRDLTEYAALYCLGRTAVTPEAELMQHRTGIPKWLAFPSPEISGRSHGLETIEGPVKENLFYGIEDQNSTLGNPELRLPKNSKMALRRRSLGSVLVITNPFLEATLTIQTLVHTFGSPALIPPRAFLPPAAFAPSAFSDRIEQERRGPFRRFDVAIYWDADFSRLWYGHPRMRDHEEWSQNFFSVLERKFAWGKTAAVDPIDFLKGQSSGTAQ